MPPSPAMRISPGRELRAENHKRGHSLESGILYREKEDDLALFNEVQNKEKEHFLLQSDDNFDDICSTKLRYFSDYKLGTSVPARGESGDLLNAEGDKNDYDWLLTPPETPLFRSLDDEAPPVNLATRGRPRSQPVSISRSPSMEKGYRSGRGSASPHRLSLSPQSGMSPRSGNNALQLRSRPFSATHSSPPPTMRHLSPSRRLSPPPSKPRPAPRSTTPTPRRLTTGSAGTDTTSMVRGTSPIKTSRGNSASPKIRAWQSNIAGFSLEAPPNLRTSLADRPASYVRGSSPASRNGSRYGRQSMSPTASRSVSSSRSHNRDPFSSHNKGLIASSGDDDVDSLQSIPVSSSDRSAPRSIGAYPCNSAGSFSKKPTKFLSSSAPKRSFDLARQMDRKSPQNMFRPLLSSVPSSTFYVGKGSAHHRSLTSRNSSITTSSNASSDQVTNGANDTEGNEQNQEDVTSDCVKGRYPDAHDEVFAMDLGECLNENIENKIADGSLGGRHGEIDGLSVVSSLLGVAESSNQLDATTARKHDYSDADGTPDMVMCSNCGLMFHTAEVVMEGDLRLCRQCKSSEVNSTITNSLKIAMADENKTEEFVQILEHRSLEVLDRSASIPESLQVTRTGETSTKHLDKIANGSQHSYSDSSQNISIAAIEEGERTFATHQVIKQLMDGDTGYQKLQHALVNSNSQIDFSEGAGISLLLKRSSSVKGHIVQSGSFAASNTSFDNFFYVRGSVNSSASVSSSVDLWPSRQTEIQIHQQSSGWKSDIENYRYEMPVRHKRSVSSLSGASSHMFQVPSVTPSCHEDNFEVIAAHMNREVGEETCADPCEHQLASEYAEAESACTDFESNVISKTASELSSHLTNVHSGDTSVLSVITSEDLLSNGNGDNLAKNTGNSVIAEASSAHSQTSIQEEDATPSSCADRLDVAEVPNPSSLDAISEMEIEDADIVSADLHSDGDSTNSKSCTVEEIDIPHPAHGVHEESRILSENTGETKARSLTLDEATDAILFCSSIVHNLAYEAANIAIDNETLPMEVLQPTATFVAKSNSERRDLRLRTKGKRHSKSQKTPQKRLETNATPPSCNAQPDEKSSPRIVVAPDNVDSMKPPKLESKCNCTIM